MSMKEVHGTSAQRDSKDCMHICAGGVNGYSMKMCELRNKAWLGCWWPKQLNANNYTSYVYCPIKVYIDGGSRRQRTEHSGTAPLLLTHSCNGSLHTHMHGKSTRCRTCVCVNWPVQEGHISSALAMELRPFCTDPSMCGVIGLFVKQQWHGCGTEHITTRMYLVTKTIQRRNKCKCA